MSSTQENSDPEPAASEEYGPRANFESIVDKFKTWKSDANSVQLKAEYDKVLKGLWWPAGSTFKSYSKEQPLVIIERKLFPYHWLCSMKQMISLEAEPLVWNDGSVGVAALETLLDRLDVFIISDSLRDITQVKHVSTGASFDVSLARALKDSNISADRTGCSRPQWRKGDWLAIKRGLFPIAPQQNMEISNDGQMYRAVLQEVRILNSPAIRQHPNFVRLFGVAWDEHTGSEGKTVITPVLVQEYATHGELSAFLRTKALEGVLTRQLKIQLITGVAEGLQTLHNLGVVHGDVKCENILVSWDAARGTFVPKVSDFGFSIVKNTTRFSGCVDMSIKTLGATRRYLAPELWTPSKTGSITLSTNLATRIDIYSFGLVLLTISLNGADIFEAFMKLLVERRSVLVRVGAQWEEVMDVLISRTKMDPRMEKYFLEGVNSLLSKRDPNFSREVYSIASKMLTQNPEARLADLSIVKSHFSPALGPDALLGPSLDGLSISNGRAIKSGLTLLPQNYERFLIDGSPAHVPILEARLGCNFLLDQISRTHEARLLRDWLGKAESVLKATNLADMTIERRATSAFCAHQAAVCHLYGVGANYDPERALELITASARAGYFTSLALVKPLHEAFGRTCPDDLPVEEALKQMIAVGPRYGFIPWALACRQLRKANQKAFDEALLLLQNHGYLELGEVGSLGGLGESNQDQIRGDPRHCCFDYGSFSFALYCIPRFPAKLFFSSIFAGLIPKASCNHNGETLLYMCCRAGDHEKVLMLLDKFEWARNEVTASTKQARFPLHWVCMMDPAFSEQVVVALIENGADSAAVDEDEFSAIDYAIQYGREDVALSLLERGKNIFVAQSSRTFGRRVILAAIQNNYFNLARKLMQQASCSDLTAALEMLGNYRQEARYEIHGKDAADALREVFNFAVSYLEGKENVVEIWKSVIRHNCHTRAADVLKAILDSKVIPDLDSSMDTCGTLAIATKLSQAVIFDGILAMVPKMQVEHAAALFAFIIKEAQGLCQFEISQSLLRKLDADGLAHDVVNYVLPGLCGSSCGQDHVHKYDPELFTVAVGAGCLEVAKLLAPYHCHQPGHQVTTMYHLLHRSEIDSGILQQLDFLLTSGLGHSDPICNPFEASSVLHEVIQTFKLFPSDSLYRDALGLLLEEYSDKIDEINQVGDTALQLAALLQNVTAVRMLLEYGANPVLEAEQGSAYEFAFRRLYVELLNANLLNQDQSIISTVWTDDANKEMESNRTVAGRIETQLGIMEMLSDGQGRPVSKRIRYDESTGEISTGNDWLGKKGLKIRLRGAKTLQMDVLRDQFTAEREKSGDRIAFLLCRKFVLFIEMDDAWYGELAAELAARGGAMPDSSSPFDYGGPSTQ